MHKLKIFGDGTMRQTRFLLDDQDITSAIKDIKIKMGVNFIPEIELTLLANVIIVDELKIYAIDVRKMKPKTSLRNLPKKLIARIQRNH